MVAWRRPPPWWRSGRQPLCGSPPPPPPPPHWRGQRQPLSDVEEFPDAAIADPRAGKENPRVPQTNCCPLIGPHSTSQPSSPSTLHSRRRSVQLALRCPASRWTLMAKLSVGSAQDPSAIAPPCKLTLTASVEDATHKHCRYGSKADGRAVP